MSRWSTFLFAVPIMPRLGAAQFAALEAARLTSTAEPDALTPAVMSGGAEPAGAAKPSPELRELERALVRLSLCVTALRNIEGGHWNAGRAAPISVGEYAAQALRALEG